MSTVITPQEFTQIIEPLGLCLNESLSFAYTNTLNEKPYKAYSASVKVKATGRSWAHFEEVNSNRSRTEQYQAIRQQYTVIDRNGREWEI